MNDHRRINDNQMQEVATLKRQQPGEYTFHARMSHVDSIKHVSPTALSSLNAPHFLESTCLVARGFDGFNFDRVKIFANLVGADQTSFMMRRTSRVCIPRFATAP